MYTFILSHRKILEVYSAYVFFLVPEFFGQRATLFSIEPVTSSLSECGRTAVGPKQWSQDIKLVISKMLAESHRTTI